MPILAHLMQTGTNRNFHRSHISLQEVMITTFSHAIRNLQVDISFRDGISLFNGRIDRKVRSTANEGMKEGGSGDAMRLLARPQSYHRRFVGTIEVMIDYSYSMNEEIRFDKVCLNSNSCAYGTLRCGTNALANWSVCRS